MMKVRMLALLVTLQCSLQPSYCSWRPPQPRQQPDVDMEMPGTRYNHYGGTPGENTAGDTRLDRISKIFLRVLPKVSTNSMSPDKGSGQGLDVYMIESGRASYDPFSPSPPGSQDSAWWELNDTEPSFPVEDNDYIDSMTFDREFPSVQDYEEDEAFPEDSNPPGQGANEAKHIPVLQKRTQSSRRNTVADVSRAGGAAAENYLHKRVHDISRWLGEKRMDLDRWYLIERARYRRFKRGTYVFWARLLGIKLGYKLTSEK